MKRLVLLLSLALNSHYVFAAGYEKTVMWGGQTSGIAGIGVPQITGSQSLYFNPAGLANGDKVDASLNVSPGWSQFKAPITGITDSSTQVSSQKHMSISGGLMGSFKVNENLGVGLGYYASGGAYADYSGLVASNGVTQGDFQAKSNLAITELALGAGYKLNENLNFGLAYRIVTATATLASFQQVAGTTFAQVEYADLKGTNYQGFKFGAQYKLSKTDLGFMYRSEAVIHAKGIRRQTVHTAGGVLPTTETGVTVGTLLPAAWSLGFKHACTETINAYGEYSFTEYSKVDNISTQTDAGASSPILLKMKDQHVIKIAGEYTGLRMPLRAGLVWGSQVTNADYALPTGSPPGQGWVVTAGTGVGFGAFKVDGGLEYSMSKGTAAGKNAANEASAYALHLGGTFAF